jgi:hypothetical protein
MHGDCSALRGGSGTKSQIALVVDALADLSVRQRFTEIGQEIFPREKQTPQSLAAQQKAEIEKWWPIVRAAGIKAE